MILRCVVCGQDVDTERERERMAHVCGSGPTRRFKLKSLGKVRDPAARESAKRRRAFKLDKAKSRR